MLGGIGYLKSRWNKKVFKLFLKAGKELAVLRSNGKLFQTSGAATKKRCLPNTVLQNGTERRCCVDDRREREGSYRSKVTPDNSTTHHFRRNTSLTGVLLSGLTVLASVTLDSGHLT